MDTGEIINFAYKCSKLFDNNKTFKCVKGIGLYQPKGKNFIVSKDNSHSRVHLTSRGKIIYAVRKKDTLFNCQEV